MEEGRNCHVLLLYRRMIPSVRLCGHCQMEELARQNYVDYRACQCMKVKSSDLNWADIVLLGRLDSWYEYQIVKRLKAAGKYLVYIIDDDLLNIPNEISSASYYRQKNIQRYIRSMIKMSNAIISPSPILLSKYATDGRKDIWIEEPAVDPISYKCHDPKQPVKIGFAGSIDRIHDIEILLKGALFQLKENYGNSVKFEFFGAVPSFAKDIDARIIPYCDSYEEYRRILNNLEWDIGLAPMPDTPFHACKHYNKFIEYAAAGIVGVFSNVEPYLHIPKEFSQVVCCGNSSSEWVARISELIDDPQRREALRKEACNYAELKLSCKCTAEKLKESIEDIVRTIRCEEKHRYYLGGYRVIDLGLRVQNKLKRMLILPKK